jgi:hypothetical protein
LFELDDDNVLGKALLTTAQAEGVGGQRAIKVTGDEATLPHKVCAHKLKVKTPGEVIPELSRAFVMPVFGNTRVLLRVVMVVKCTFFEL